MKFAKETRWCARILTPVALAITMSACQTQGTHDELPDKMIAMGYEYEAENPKCRAMLQELSVKYHMAKADKSHIPAFREGVDEIYAVCGIEVY